MKYRIKLPTLVFVFGLFATSSGLAQVEQARQQFEHDYLVKVLRLTNGSVAEAALLAQRNRTDFYKLLKRHNINPEQFKDKE